MLKSGNDAAVALAIHTCGSVEAFAEKMKWEVVAAPVEQKQGLKEDKYLECLTLGKAMADRLGRD